MDVAWHMPVSEITPFQSGGGRKDSSANAISSRIDDIIPIDTLCRTDIFQSLVAELSFSSM